MTEREGNLSCDCRTEKLTEGGPQPALGPASGTMVPNSTSAYQDVGKVYDLISFGAFVRRMAGQYQNGDVSYDDALEMIACVAKFRKLHETFGDDQIWAVIQNNFLLVVKSADHDAAPAQELASFPGVITAEQLQAMDFEPATLVVPPLLAEGVTLFAGKPKLGKSWLMLDLAVAVANGTEALGNVETSRGQVLGLFLEDSERRLQARMRRLDATPDASWSSDLHLATNWRRLDAGGLSDIEAWCANAGCPKLIIIDTLAKLRPAQGSRKSAYDLDYEALSGLHKIAHKYQVAIVVVHHTRKAEAADVFDTVSGTLGLTGAADSILVLAKKSGNAVLYARGRDIEDSETALKFDPARCRWVRLGSAVEVPVSNERAQIIAAADAATGPVTPTQLMVATKLRNRNALDLLLFKMVKDGQLAKLGRGRYTSPGKIGKKDDADLQAVDDSAENEATPNLSDLSGSLEIPD